MKKAWKNVKRLWAEPIWGFGQTAAISTFTACMVGRDGLKTGLYIAVTWLVYLAGAATAVYFNLWFERKNAKK